MPATIVTAFAFAVFALSLTSCGDDGAGPGLSAVELNEEAWGEYILGEYAGARALFEQAVSKDANLTEARLGLAWSDAHMGNYTASVSGFDAVIASGEHKTDAFAGRAAAALEMPDYPLSIASADSALTRDPDYFFERQAAYNSGDLRLILAQSYFALAEYGASQDQVDLIDPGNGLDPSDAETWVVGDTTYPTYESALAILIERLWSLEGGL
jgi:tetratricopeptide (TPR) repeat protein